MLIGAPIAWWLMTKWLEGFAYRMNIVWWVPVVSGAAVITVALVTVTVQAVKAATANPVKSLRSE